MKKHLKHSNFSFFKNFLVCLFPNNIRDFREKRVNILKKGGKNGGEQTNSKNFLEKRQSQNFCLTTFPNPTGTK